MDPWSALARRPLPRPLAAVQDETLTSFLQRLAALNRLDPTALRTYLTGSNRTGARVPVAELALLSGQDPHALRYAILELNTSDELRDPRLAHRPQTHRHSRLRCTHCTLARGHRDPVWCWTHPEDTVCHRHRRWTGGGDEPWQNTQPSLRAHPEVLRAHHRHRALVRRHGRSTISFAFDQANTICRKWHIRFEQRDEFNQLMARFHGGCGWRVMLSDPTVLAARYPQAVALTAQLLSPTQ